MNLNLKEAYVADIETTGLLPDIKDSTDLHVFSMSYLDKSENIYKVRSTRDLDDIKKVLEDPKQMVVGHNFYMFDILALEKMFGDLEVKCQIVDTLLLSWYLEPNRFIQAKNHGLESYGEDFGVPKPEITDWKNLTYQEYVNRAEEDVKINTNLWHSQVNKLMKIYNGDQERVMSFLHFLSTKGKVYQMHYRNPLRLDLENCKKNLAEIEEKIARAEGILIKAMPDDPIYNKRKRPKVMYRKDGSLSVIGQSWVELLKDQHLPLDYDGEVKYIKKYRTPNPHSNKQVKDWLYSFDWKPDYYVDVKTKEGFNSVPQVKDKEKNLCKSVEELVEKEPAIKELGDLGLLVHKAGYLKGFLRDHRDGNLVAGISGLTNTLRIKHRTLVNLPRPGIKFGEYVRSVLAPPKGHVIIGSDLSGLENTTRNNFVLKYDRKFVELQDHPYYDPHLEIAVIADMMTEDESNFYKFWKAFQKDDTVKCSDIDPNWHWLDSMDLNEDQKEEMFHKLDKTRHNAKTTNYSAMYGVGAFKLSKELGITQGEARKLIDAYWRKNWATKHFASKCKTKTVDGQMWVLNPLNNYWYSLRFEKDIFSTVNQSAGDYIFTLWQHNLMKLGVTLRAGFHDEVVVTCPPEDVDETVEKLYRAIGMVNAQLKLDVPVHIHHQIGNNYSEVH